MVSIRTTRSDILPRMRSRRLRELRRLAATQENLGVEVTPYEAMPALLNDAWGYYLWARRMAGDITDDAFWLTDPRTGEKTPCAEFELEDRLRSSVKAICESMIRTDIDEKGSRIEEAKLAVLGAAISVAAEEAGLDEDQKRKLGSALRSELERMALS